MLILVILLHNLIIIIKNCVNETLFIVVKFIEASIKFIQKDGKSAFVKITKMLKIQCFNWILRIFVC